jgi:DNA-binding GntR family transcriptional regulator
MVSRVLPPGEGRKSSADITARYIRRLIFDGELRPGERVPQDQIAETLGISRIPVREALIALEREGWVRIELHRGVFVTPIDEQTVRDHYELYGLVYGFAARRALGRDGDLDTLVGIERRIQVFSDAVELGQLSVEFHHTVVREARSPRIEVVLRAISALVPGQFFVEVPSAIEIQKKGTAAILRAVRRGDPDRAADEYLRVMRRLGDQVVEVFKARKLFDEAA